MGPKKIKTCINNLNSALSKRNFRLVHKYKSELQELLDILVDACVDAELSDVDETKTWMAEAHEADNVGQSCLVFLLILN